jgi:hypothetical protein
MKAYNRAATFRLLAKWPPAKRQVSSCRCGICHHVECDNIVIAVLESYLIVGFVAYAIYIYKKKIQKKKEKKRKAI